MNSRGVTRHVLLALATAFMLIDYSAFAQAPQSVDGASAEARKIAIAKQPGINRDSVQPAPATIKLTGPATISFLPADIFDRIAEPETIERWSYPANVSSALKKDVTVAGEDDASSLAKKMRNPVSSLARIYFENNLDFALGANREGYRYTMNLEPLIPFALNRDWNLISRTRIPLIQQDGVVESMQQTGVGDILQSFFLSPSKTEPVFWGAGTTLLIPTATDRRLGSGKFGLGPALVVGKQHRAWTYGVLARHIWSVAGHKDREDVRSTYIQPFVAYTTRSAWTFALDTESTYDWMAERWSVPIHVEVAKVVKFARHPVSVGAALTCWAGSVPGGPQACGVRFSVTPLFPAR